MVQVHVRLFVASQLNFHSHVRYSSGKVKRKRKQTGGRHLTCALPLLASRTIFVSIEI